MTEFELKFQVDERARAGLRRTLMAAGARGQTLQAVYFDTPGRSLARAGVALRLRREGRLWVQTLKAASPGALERLEHEVRLGHAQARPALDIQRHAGTPVGERLAALCAVEPDLAQRLGPRFETRVKRLIHFLHEPAAAGAAQVEVALDIGELRAGDATLPLWEIEFELKQGSAEGLARLVAPWVQSHGLWLDIRSKAERGERLAAGVASGPVAMARDAGVTPAMDPASALRAMVASTLEQALPNAAELAAGSGGPGHLHQLRVALRRLRTALRVFGDAGDPHGAALEARVAMLFAQLGAARDLDALQASVLPALRAAGAPSVDLADAATGDPGATLRDARSAALWLELIAFAHTAAPAAEAMAVAGWARQRLRRLHKRLRAEARDFLQLDDPARHRARKRAKRLRYSLEFTAALFDGAEVARYLRRLRRALDGLGQYNDLCVAEELFRARAAADPAAWFGVGWSIATRQARLPALARRLQRLPALPALPRPRPRPKFLR